MLKIRICVAAIILVEVTVGPNLTHAGDLRVEAGVGYDFISQEYFLDSLLIDTLEASLALKTTYLDAFKGRLGLSWAPFMDRRLELRSSYEQTLEDIRIRFEGDLRTHVGSTAKVAFRHELERREGTADSLEPGESYTFALAQSKLELPITNSLSGWGLFTTDFVHFDSISQYSYSHYRLGGKLGAMKTFADFSALDFDLFCLARQVPDSSALNYLSFGLEASFFGFYDRRNLDLSGRLERKDYNSEDDQDDYTRLEFDGHHKAGLGGLFFVGQELSFEAARFHADDLINSDYARIGVILLAGVQAGSFDLSLGPSLAVLAERSDEVSDGEDYFEAGLEINLDLLEPGLIFGALESTLGRRNLGNESYLLSDFTYERLNLIADCNLFGGLNLNILLSAEWEWHDAEEENNQILLLSSGLFYTFE